MDTDLKSAARNSGGFWRNFVIFGLFYLVIAWLVVEFIHEKPFLSTFDSTTPIAQQILIGLAIGSIIGAFQAILLRYWTFWRERQAKIAEGSPELFQSPPLQFILISLLVGITEEIAFRAAIQPAAGIWLTSILFTAVHLNFDFSTIKKSDFPITALSVGMVFAVSLIMGLLFAQFGLFASIAAHIIYDSVVLFAYKNLLSTIKSDMKALTTETF